MKHTIRRSAGVVRALPRVFTLMPRTDYQAFAADARRVESRVWSRMAAQMNAGAQKYDAERLR